MLNVFNIRALVYHLYSLHVCSRPQQTRYVLIVMSGRKDLTQYFHLVSSSCLGREGPRPRARPLTSIRYFLHRWRLIVCSNLALSDPCSCHAGQAATDLSRTCHRPNQRMGPLSLGLFGARYKHSRIHKASTDGPLGQDKCQMLVTSSGQTQQLNARRQGHIGSLYNVPPE